MITIDGIIYTLADNDGKVFYVGCTIESLETRLQQHLTAAKSPKAEYNNSAKSKMIRDLDFEITASVVDMIAVSGENKMACRVELTKKEREWIEKLIKEGC